MSNMSITVHWCPHCEAILDDATFETFKDHVLTEHSGDKVLVEAVTNNDGWRDD